MPVKMTRAKHRWMSGLFIRGRACAISYTSYFKSTDCEATQLRSYSVSSGRSASRNHRTRELLGQGANPRGERCVYSLPSAAVCTGNGVTSKPAQQINSADGARRQRHDDCGLCSRPRCDPLPAVAKRLCGQSALSLVAPPSARMPRGQQDDGMSWAHPESPNKTSGVYKRRKGYPLPQLSVLTSMKRSPDEPCAFEVVRSQVLCAASSLGETR